MEDVDAPELRSFSTSQPSNGEEVKPEEVVGTQEDKETEEKTTEESKTPKAKGKKTTVVRKDANLIDIDSDDEEGEGSSGTTVLQLSKIKKIFKVDPEHVSASEAAVFSTAIATELFIQYLTEQASLIARSEKRKKLQYKDFSAAVSNIEQLHFLSDTVPKTVNLKKLVDQNKVNYNSKPLEKGQQTLGFGGKSKNAKEPVKKASVDDEELPDSDPEELEDDDDDEEADGKTAEVSVDGEENNVTEDDVEQDGDGTVLDKDKDVVMSQ